VVRAFDNPEVVHVEDSVDPVRDLETIMYELCRKDTVYVDAVRARKELDVRKDPKNKLPPVTHLTELYRLVIFTYHPPGFLHCHGQGEGNARRQHPSAQWFLEPRGNLEDQRADSSGYELILHNAYL